MKNKLWLLSVPFFLLLSSCGYNALQRMDEEVKGNWSEVENQYQRRYDLIPNLVNVVKGYAKHEKETLESVIKARSEASQIKVDASTLSDPEKFKQYQGAQDGISRALSRLMVLTEQYPDLKANQNFRDLQAQLEGTENRIAVARKRYIDKVVEFNSNLRSFPYSLTNSLLLHLKPKENFSISEEAKAAPKIQF